MDVSNILASHAAKFQTTNVEKDIAIEVDPGYLTTADFNSIDEESYKWNLEEHLQSLARDGTQALINALFSLPTASSPEGPIAQLPPPTTELPRAKPLPKPKPPTKWELFAAAKGIQKKKKEKKEWDEERQEWVDRWGKDGKNKQVEEQWLTEVPHNANIDHDPRKTAREERKARVAKNEKQRLQNLARAAETTPQESRKRDIERTLVQARTSTASMGRFDKQLEGEKKPRGIKRKFNPTETSADDERKASLALLTRMESDDKKMRKESPREGNIVNVRKAVRHASKGEGAIALARKGEDGKKRKGRR
ncbi:hypothetical protein AMATHDRAFT_148094 [Amanita thiersii Skay4041]|uniref:Ribosome biogenesis regulatory protein n=1 Tax=Amanita thiersii Skay4041 TaxID=703135 RepID=A0A2A9NF43_9AGAR|nr:hypothetical protein AMATHDRAFT_148094 [Amanita thiersii Skay4041]